MKPINIKDKLEVFNQHWQPHRIAKVDNMQVLLAKISGTFVWHSHKEEDELFYVQKGTLIMQFRDSQNPENAWSETVQAGEIIVVPKGMEHCPTTFENEEVQLLLFEKLSTKHTGEVTSELTKNTYPDI